jgi:hypothetical protein
MAEAEGSGVCASTVKWPDNVAHGLSQTYSRKGGIYFSNGGEVDCIVLVLQAVSNCHTILTILLLQSWYYELLPFDSTTERGLP